MAKKFQVWETNGGTDVGEPFEATDREEALAVTLEKQDYAVKEVVDPEDRVDITITVSGGLIQSVDIPEHLDNVVVVVKDYDTDGSDENLQKDGDGEYMESEWRA